MTMLICINDDQISDKVSSIAYEFFPEINTLQASNIVQCRDLMKESSIEILCISTSIFSGQNKLLEYMDLLRFAYPTCYIVLMGNEYDTVQLVKKCFKMGIGDYITFPIDDVKLREAFSTYKEPISNDTNKIEFTNNHISKWIEPSLRSSFTYDFIFGNLTNVKEIYEKTSILGLANPPNVVMVVEIDNFHRDTSDKSELLKHNVRQEVYQVVQESLLDTTSAMPSIVGPDSIAIVLAVEDVRYNSDEIKSILISMAEKVCNNVEGKTNMTVSIGIGSFMGDFRRLHLSYQEASRALNHKFFSGCNQVIHIDDIEPYTDNSVKFEVEYALLQAIKLGDLNTSHQCVERLSRNIFAHSNIEPESLKLQSFEFLATLAGAAKEGDADEKKLVETELKLGAELRTLEIASDLEKWLYLVVDNLCKLVLERHNQHALKAVRQAVKYIEDNYSSDLSLDEIAKHVFLSPNYLSGIFRKETGFTVRDYIVNARIQKAKELLQDIGNSISSVALQVGFNDPRYFCRVFKVMVGVPPSKYRSR